MTGEKLTEQQVVLAFSALGAAATGTARTFVVAPQWGNPPFYRLHVEDDRRIDAGVSALANAFDARLREINVEYASKRASGRLGPVTVNVLPPGYLGERDRRIASRQRAANEQFKHCFLMSEIDADASFPAGAESALGR